MQLPDVAGYLSSILSGGLSRQTPRNTSLENPSVSLDDPSTWDALGYRPTDSGIEVCPEDALRFGPVWQCLEVLSSDVAAATMHCHKNEAAPGESDIDTNQPAETVCSLEWNEITPACEGWMNLVFHHKLFGSGYAYISRQGGSKNGRIQWMANMVPTAVKPMVDPDSKQLMYEYILDGKTYYLNTWEVFHLKGMGFRPNHPLSLFDKMRNEVGLALASKLWLGKFFERGGHHGGILSVPPAMKKEARENLEKGVAERSKPSNWFKTLILRDGAAWHSATVDPRTAQMHELTEDEARAVCHFLNVPPSKIGLPGSVSYNSQEQAQLQYITGSLLHITTRINGEAQMKLLSDRTRRARSHRFEWNWSKLIESDTKTLNEICVLQVDAEITNRNEARKKLNLPQRTDEKANEYYNSKTRASNDATANQDDANADTGNSQSETKNLITTPSSPISENMKPLVDEAVMRAGKRLTTVVKNLSRKPGKIVDWVDNGGSEHSSIVDEELTTTLTVCAPASAATMKPLAKAWMMSGISSTISPLLQAPYLSSDLESNVKSATDRWLSSLVSEWNKEFNNAENREIQ